MKNKLHGQYINRPRCRQRHKHIKYEKHLGKIISICIKQQFRLSFIKKFFNTEAELEKSRSSRLEVFCKKGVLRNFAKFAGKRLCQSLYFNKATDWGLQETLAQVLFCEFCKIYKNTFSYRTTLVAASEKGVAYKKMRAYTQWEKTKTLEPKRDKFTSCKGVSKRKNFIYWERYWVTFFPSTLII